MSPTFGKGASGKEAGEPVGPAGWPPKQSEIVLCEDSFHSPAGCLSPQIQLD